MIILTADQADHVRGLTTKGHALAPVPLKDGTFVLPIEVLTDPAHAKYFDLLKSLPQRQVNFGTPSAKPFDDALPTDSELADKTVTVKYVYKTEWVVGALVAIAEVAAEPVDALPMNPG